MIFNFGPFLGFEPTNTYNYWPWWSRPTYTDMAICCQTGSTCHGSKRSQWSWLSTSGGGSWVVAMVFVPVIWKSQHHNTMDRELFHETLTWYQQLDFRYCWVLWVASLILSTQINCEVSDGNNGGKQTWYRIVKTKAWLALTKYMKCKWYDIDYLWARIHAKPHDHEEIFLVSHHMIWIKSMQGGVSTNLPPLSLQNIKRCGIGHACRRQGSY